MSQDATLRFYHRVDDPWSHLLLQVLPQLLATYAVELECVTVPLPPFDYFSRPDMVARHALRDAQDLRRHCELEFESTGSPPPAALVEAATRRLLAADGPAEGYLPLAAKLGAALFRGDEEALLALCETQAMPAAQAHRRLQANQRRQLEEGHFNSGMLAFGSNWYWGVDRLSHLEHDLAAAGLRRPQASVGVLQRRPARLAMAARPHAVVDPLEIDFFCSFRSPYAYVAAQRTFDLQRRYPLKVRPRLIIPMKMSGFAIPELKRAYFRSDPAREALRHGVRFGNFCDPFGPGLERAMAVAELAQARGLLEPYVLSVMQGVWAEGIDTATDAGLQQLVERAGLDWAEAQPRLTDQGWRSWADGNRQELDQIGQYACPTFRMDGWVTWGQDRLWMLEREVRARLGLEPV